MQGAASSQYVPRNILLTGGAGFIGSHVVERLVTHPASYKFVRGDITNTDFVLHILKEEQIDTIMNFAAQTHVDNSFGNSFSFTQNNVYGTHTLLESARLYGNVRRFIHVSTDEVYGESSHGSGTASTETAVLDPTNPYAATKAAAEMLVKAYSCSYKLPCIITRGNNVYGPRQYPEKLVPKFILLARRGSKLPIHGTGRSMRSFLHVADVASAFDLVLHRGLVGETYNIGTNSELSVLQVAEAVCEHFSLNKDSVVEFVQDRLFNDRRYFIDNSKLRALGWNPQVVWSDGLKQTIGWYCVHANELRKYWPGYEHALIAHPIPGASLSNDAALHSSVKDDSPTGPIFLVYGRTGWIGGLLGKILTSQGARWSFGNARLEDRGAIHSDVRQHKPTHVLNAAGVTGRPNVDWCESHRQETVRTNVVGVLNLVDVCKQHNIHVTNFATGCIYSYDSSHALGSGCGFRETDPPNFAGSYYSRTKGMVESLLIEYDNLLQLRLRMPISSDLTNERNFVHKIINYSKVVNIPNSMSVLDELLPVAVSLARNGLTGIFNFTNPGTISHNEVLELYRQYVDPSFTWQNFSEEEQSKVLQAPRSNNELDATKLVTEAPGVHHIKESLIKFVFEPALRNGVTPQAMRKRV